MFSLHRAAAFAAQVSEQIVSFRECEYRDRLVLFLFA